MTHHVHIFPDGPYLVTLPEKPRHCEGKGFNCCAGERCQVLVWQDTCTSILSDPEKRVKFKSELDVTNLLMRSVMNNKSTLSPVEWLEKRRGQTFELPANVGVKIEYQLRSLFGDDCWNETDEEGYNLSMSLFNKYGRTNCLRKVAIILPEQPKEEKTVKEVLDGIICPFCAEIGFDKPGLKYHLQVNCVELMNTENL